MNVDPCTVCGGTDLNLVDGFYYCVECGTQDVNARETVVAHALLSDGTLARANHRKFTTVLRKEGIEMNGEWYKWHAFNFILCGLADELVALGARPSFKTKLLWVWTRYIKKFQVKEDEGEASQLLDEDKQNDTKASKTCDIENFDEEISISNKKLKQSWKHIRTVNKCLIVAILYTALNLDCSHIQLSNFLRYVRDGRISLANCKKFVPKELNLTLIPHWISFMSGLHHKHSTVAVRQFAMDLFKLLDLGIPLVPDLRKIVDNFVKELSLPNDFKNVVFSLMNLVPCDSLDIDRTKDLIRVPDYEGVVMAYVLVALKMCFGLDDDYEIRLSNRVDKINNEECYMKSFKLRTGMEATDRLFSFREWCNYLQFRKIMLCKYYLPMAKQHNLDVDDFVFMEQSEERSKRKIERSDEVAMDILNKIQLIKDTQVIPKTEFRPSLTPISTYTDIIIQGIQDPELKLLLSENFTQYSLKYACIDLKLLIRGQNIITGVNDTNKTVNPVVNGTLLTKSGDKNMVYVRNCENKNWIKTKPPTEDHVTKIEDDSKESDSDPGYDSNIEVEVSSMADNIPVKVTSEADNIPVKVTSKADNIPVKVTSKAREKKGSIAENTEAKIQDGIDKTETALVAIQEEATDKFIFDDTFEDVEDDKKEETKNMMMTETENNSFEFHYDPSNISDSKSDTCNLSLASFNPVIFDREKTIKELILTACKRYKIPIPREYNTKEPRKRKPPLVHIRAGQSDAKRRKVTKRLAPREAKQALNRIFAAYYSNVEKDVSNEVSDDVNSTLQKEGLNEIEEECKSKSSITLDDVTSNQNEVNQHFIECDNDEQNKHLTDVDDEENTENNVIANSDDEDLIPKTNPKFDTETYDSSQLYLKFKEEVNLDDILDPDLIKFFDNKISEAAENDLKTFTEDLEEHQSSESDDDSDDDIPLARIVEKKNLLLERELQMKNLEPLIKTPENLQEFKYWFRHYTSHAIGRCPEMMERFDLELNENCPSSFNFIMYECAAILNCSAFSLYKHIQNIEQVLIYKASISE